MDSHRVEKPSRVACAECRRKHIRCDAASPVCGRCLTEKLVCEYIPSRRGLARRKTTSRHDSVNGTSTPQSEATFENSEEPARFASRPTMPSSIVAAQHPTPAYTPSPWYLSDADTRLSINLFYTRFWPAHPILVPQAFYATSQISDDLKMVICYIGQHYAPKAGVPLALHEATSLAMSSDSDRSDVHRVQALVLYTIILHARHETREAESCICRAARIALDLGMNEPNFAYGHAPSDPRQEESIRRTWWELYIVDAYVAALHRRSTFTTSGIRTLPLLPSSQKEFGGAEVAHLRPDLQAFDARVFGFSLTTFSSYCYRIEAVRIVERVSLLAPYDDRLIDNIQSVDNAIASWKYHLPDFGVEVVNASGEVDQLLFQAHFMILCSSIFLHFPRSDLPATVPSAASIACAESHTQLIPTSSQHTVKAIAASKEISNLAAVPCELSEHSPFFTCALILGCIVQLAAASTHSRSCKHQHLQQHRDRVVLMLGVLKRLGEKWAVAHNAVAQLRMVAETVFNPGSNLAETNSSTGSGDELHLAQSSNPMSWFDLFSPGVLQDEFTGVPSNFG